MARLIAKIVRRPGRPGRPGSVRGPGRPRPRSAAQDRSVPATAQPAITQRSGPVSTRSSGARSGSHGRYGTLHSSRSASGATTRASAPIAGRSPDRNRTSAAIEPIATHVEPRAHHRCESGASSATRTGPAEGQLTIWIDAGASQIAEATATGTPDRSSHGLGVWREMVASLWRDAVAKASHDVAVSCGGGGPITANAMEPGWGPGGGYFFPGSLLV